MYDAVSTLIIIIFTETISEIYLNTYTDCIYDKIYELNTF